MYFFSIIFEFSGRSTISSGSYIKFVPSLSESIIAYRDKLLEY